MTVLPDVCDLAAAHTGQHGLPHCRTVQRNSAADPRDHLNGIRIGLYLIHIESLYPVQLDKMYGLLGFPRQLPQVRSHYIYCMATGPVKGKNSPTASRYQKESV